MLVNFFNVPFPCSVMVNRFDVTRVNFTVPLREHFSLPFIFLQFLLAGQFLAMKTEKDNKPPSWTRWSLLAAIYCCSLLFTIFWQSQACDHSLVET